MQIYKVSEATYHGSGWCLAAILGSEVVKLVYLEDLLPDDLADMLGTPHAAFAVKQWLTLKEAAPYVRELQALGQVSVGMASGGEFVEQ